MNISRNLAATAVLVAFLGTGFTKAEEPPIVSANGKYLTVDYQPFFPIGLYHFPDRRTDDGIWKEAAEAGFNFVLADEPGKHGMYVSRRIPTRRVDGKSVPLLETYRDPSFVQSLKQFVAENEQDPTNLCWHSTDEPGWFGPSYSALLPGYQLIRDHSKKPVWLNVGPSFTEVQHYNTPFAFTQTADILSEDIYPIPDGKRKEGQGYNLHAYDVGEHTRRLVEMVSRDGAQEKPVWMVLQGFGWGDLGGFNNPPEFVPPTRQELRFMAYDAIVHGATGLLSYGPFSTKSEANARLWDDWKALAGELKRHYEILTCPSELLSKKIRVTLSEPSDEKNPIHLLIKLREPHAYVIAVNTRPEPQPEVTFRLLDENESVVTRVRELEENRVLPTTDNKSWTDSFEGYGVHLYETDLYYAYLRRYRDDPKP